jgi:hypothetical protein
MIKSSHPHLYLLAIVSVLLLLFTIVHCNNNYDDDDQMETIFYEKRLASIDPLYDLFEQNNVDDEDINIITRNSLKPLPDRRSSFHAMRGKRRAIIS